MALTQEEIISIVGPVDRPTLAEIAATEASVEELREAAAWLANDEALVNEGRRLPGPRVATLIELLDEPVEER
ncbi:hypothetical protein ABGN05_02125 [Aquibium sp. LZ166]|uniref:Uncharacterized protein n=1 Tax=Aquibium pacificus TaxID=3153579 RepID=A0ABV3SEG8_9HYPH